MARDLGAEFRLEMLHLPHVPDVDMRMPDLQAGRNLVQGTIRQL